MGNILRRTRFIKRMDIVNGWLKEADRMKKQNLAGSVIILLLVIGLCGCISPPAKDIDVTILEIDHQDNQFYVNVTVKNNQDKTGWIDDVHLTTANDNIISMTGAGIDEKIEPGHTIEITLYSAEVYVSIVDPPFNLAYAAFPSGNTYTVLI